MNHQQIERQLSIAVSGDIHYCLAGLKYGDFRVLMAGELITNDH
jgi:hypothetical protein